MASRTAVLARSARLTWSATGARVLTALAFLVLFWAPLSNTVRVWWTNADAGHGLLLAPLAFYLAWRRGVSPRAVPQPALGLLLLVSAVLLRYLSGLAAEVFTMRLAAVGAGVALVVIAWGVRQVLHWWLPLILIVLSVPLPEILLSALALPLQLKASQMGAVLLDWRHVPVALAGNVIHLPGGHRLFVTEACSGLRSLSALIALGVLIGGLFLHTPWARVLIALLTIPIAMGLNAVRIFLTGFVTHYIDPALGEGLMHYTEGWVLFVVALGLVAGVAWLLNGAEGFIRSRQAPSLEAAA